MNNLQTLTNQESVSSSLILRKYSTSSPCYPGIDIKATGVYNLLEGVVWQEGWEENDLLFLVIKMSNNCMFRYGHLDVAWAHEYSRVRPGELIGTAKKYFTFEYLTRVKSMFPVYVGDYKFYKQDPSDIIINDVLPSISSSESTYKHTSDAETILLGSDS